MISYCYCSCGFVVTLIWLVRYFSLVLVSWTVLFEYWSWLLLLVLNVVFGCFRLGCFVFGGCVLV